MLCLHWRQVSSASLQGFVSACISKDKVDKLMGVCRVLNNAKVRFVYGKSSDAVVRFSALDELAKACGEQQEVVRILYVLYNARGLFIDRVG